MDHESAEDWYLERCAVREYDGGYPRHVAERLALDDYKRMLEKQALTQVEGAP